MGNLWVLACDACIPNSFIYNYTQNTAFQTLMLDLWVPDDISDLLPADYMPLTEETSLEVADVDPYYDDPSEVPTEFSSGSRVYRTEHLLNELVCEVDKNPHLAYSVVFLIDVAKDSPDYSKKWWRTLIFYLSEIALVSLTTV